MEFVNLISFFIMFGTKLAWWKMSRQVNFKFVVGDTAYHEDLEYVAGLYEFALYWAALCTVLCFLQVLKYLSLNPRLHVLTKAISAAQQNIVGVLALFFVVVFAFSLCGNALFGAGVADFRNLEVSFSALMRTLIGDAPYDDMKAENYFLAGVFFWAYLVLCLFLLLNFIMAVIGNGFNEENDKLVANDLYEQVAGFLQIVVRGLKRFFTHPIDFFVQWWEARKLRLRKGGKVRIGLRGGTEVPATAATKRCGPVRIRADVCGRTRGVLRQSQHHAGRACATHRKIGRWWTENRLPHERICGGLLVGERNTVSSVRRQ